MVDQDHGKDLYVKNDFFRMLCGELLGTGSARSVYQSVLDDHLVFKFETKANSFQNVIEWETWERIKETEFAKWFAPCVAISPCGSVLIMQKTTRSANHPDKVPGFFTDLKCANFGILVGKNAGDFVCHDYGVHLLMEKGMTKRLRTANWWNE